MLQPSAQNGSHSHDSQRRTEHSSSWLGGPPGRQLQGKGDTTERLFTLPASAVSIVVPHRLPHPPLLCYGPQQSASCSRPNTPLPTSTLLGVTTEMVPFPSNLQNFSSPFPLQWDIQALCGMTRQVTEAGHSFQPPSSSSTCRCQLAPNLLSGGPRLSGILLEVHPPLV